MFRQVIFQVENIHTMAELKMTGNCLRASRPLLSFDLSFTAEPHWQVVKELFVQIFGVPNHHPKSQPFYDHVYTFSLVDGKVRRAQAELLRSSSWKFRFKGTLTQKNRFFMPDPVSRNILKTLVVFRILNVDFFLEIIWRLCGRAFEIEERLFQKNSSCSKIVFWFGMLE